MTGADMRSLTDIWLALPPASTSLLKQHGVSPMAAALTGGVCVAPDGQLVVGAFDDPPSIYHMIIEPLLIDLLTFNPEQPNRWVLQRGDAVMLGDAMLREAQFHNDPLPVFRDPLSWLRAGGIGVMPIDLPAFARAVLWTPALELVVKDVHHGIDLERVIDRAAKIDKPIITVEMQEAA